MKSPLFNLYLSDTHFGSDQAPMPPKIELLDGALVGHGSNKRQKWMHEKFEQSKKSALAIIGKEPFVLTFGGDLIEGVHHHTKEITATRVHDHLHIANHYLKDLIYHPQCKMVYVVRGTACHVGHIEQLFCDQHKLQQPRQAWKYRMNNCLVDARHHMPVTSRKHLESGALGIVMANCISNSVRAKHEVPKVFLRAHRHVSGTFTDDENMIVVCGGWQFLTEYGHQKVTDSISIPSLKVLDWTNSKSGALPVVHAIKHDPPEDICYT